MSRATDLLTSFAASAFRPTTGARALGHVKEPQKLLELYEFEACPYCRKAREALTMLDLDALIYPCPKNGTRYRPKAKELGGKALFPFLVDPNTERQLYESNDIITYLFEAYGGRPAPKALFNSATSFLSSALRPGKGMSARRSSLPQEPLELYNFEASPFCRIVRETLCELELPYIVRNVGKGKSPLEWLPPAARRRFASSVPFGTERRRAFAARSGQMMVPYLIDPNTGKEMFESADIKQYLLDTYAV